MSTRYCTAVLVLVGLAATAGGAAVPVDVVQSAQGGEETYPVTGIGSVYAVEKMYGQNGVEYVILGVNKDNVGKVIAVDVRDPTNPSVASIFTSSVSTCNYVQVKDRTVYAGCGQYLAVLDGTDPRPMQVLSYTDVGGYFKGLAVRGTWAVLSTTFTLEIYDVANPTSPTHLGSYTQPSGYRLGRVTTWNYVAYVHSHTHTSQENRIHLLDILNPLNVYKRGEVVSNLDNIYDILIDGSGYLFTAGRGGVEISYIRPDVTGGYVVSRPVATEAWGLDLTGNRRTLYVGNRVHGVKVYDVTDHSSPVLVRSAYVLSASHLRVHGIWAMVSTHNQGMVTLRLTPPTPAPTPLPPTPPPTPPP
eukprot:Sspe_Gene.107092::Locus_85162_Transcript_2_2_Confidence_0.750_Length_1124::g.107092::m.107092